MIRKCLLAITAVLLIVSVSCREKEAEVPPVPITEETPKAPRNPKWAAPIENTACPNFFKVSDDLYRGAKPSSECIEELKELGVKTIVNLQSFHSDRDEIGETGIGYEHIYMKAWHGEDEEVVRFLQIVSDPARTPVFVHCRHGADRTGTMCAIYRIAIQGWTLDETVDELTNGGFGWHSVWNKTLLPYLKELDIDEMKKRAGVSE